MDKTKNKRRGAPSLARAAASTACEIPIDSRATDILELIVLLLARRNYARADMRRVFEHALASTPDWVGAEATGAGDPNDLPGEVLTRWHLLPRYSLDGQPRPLPDTGRLSLTSLIRSITRRINPVEVIGQLTQTHSIRKDKGLNLPTERALRVRRDPRLQRLHHVRVVQQLLQTVEGNARRQEPLRRFEFHSIGVVPRSEYATLVEKHGDAALAFLESVDRDFLLRTNANLPERDTIQMTVGVIFSDSRSLPPLTPPDSERGEDASR